MKKTGLNVIKNKLAIGLFLMCIFLTVVFADDSVYTIIPLENWEYCYDKTQSESWQAFHAPGQPSNPKKLDTVYVRTSLPKTSWRDPALFFVTNDQFFEVHIDGKLIYKYGDIASLRQHQGTGSPWHMISLPENYQEKLLEIKMKTNFVKSTGLIRIAKIGLKSDLQMELIRNNMSSFILSCLFIFLGLGILFVFYLRKQGQKAYFFLGCASICVGGWLVGEGSLKQLFIYAPRGWYYTAMTFFFLIPIWFCMFVEELFAAKYRFVLRSMAYLQVGFTILSISLEMLNLYSMVSMLVYQYVLSISSLVICTFCVSKYAFLGDKEARIYVLGFTVLTSAALYDILGWFYRIIPWYGFASEWAMLVFILTLTYILAGRCTEIHNKVQSYSKEIQSKDKSIEEQQKRLEQAMEYDKMKTEFIANISHELRTPLNIIWGSIQLLKLNIENDPMGNDILSISKRIKVMQQNTNRLIRLVNNLIDITKIEGGYFSLELQNHNIVSIVEDITMSVADFMKGKGIELSFDTEIEEKIMACDPDKIERILLNLLSNAVKFSQPGANIYVNILDREDEVRIEVKDDGIGITEDNIDTIFDRFVQVDKSLTRSHEGSGIGLALVKSLVEMHGGKISVQSEYGVGTTFIISLPVRMVEQENPQDAMLFQEVGTHVEKINVEFSDIYS